MKNIKKIFTLLISLMVIVSLSACNNSESDSDISELSPSDITEEFFSAFESSDYETMKSYCTESCIEDYFHGIRNHKLCVHDEYGPNMDMPVKTYFRGEKDLPELEQKALQLCKGKVLDIGAGAGSHALWLQQKGFDVTALEISPKAAKVIEERGVNQVIQQDIFSFKEHKFDTLLLLMNGIGLSATIAGLRRFLKHAKTLLNDGGQLVFDSSDLAYLYEGEEFPTTHYYGEIKCRYEYKKAYSDWITWLYIDQDFLKSIAQKAGFKTEIIFEDGNDQYLARLTIA